LDGDFGTLIRNLVPSNRREEGEILDNTKFMEDTHPPSIILLAMEEEEDVEFLPHSIPHITTKEILI